MADRRIIKKPRVKRPKRKHEFWCYFHKRFFEERKKFEHCIPRGCFQFSNSPLDKICEVRHL